MATHNQVRLIGYLTSDPKIINEGKPGEEKILMNLKTTRRDADGYSGDRYCEVIVYYSGENLMSKFKTYRHFDILDINMGCPVPKVVNNGEGSALLKNPELIVQIIKSVSSAIQKPVTVKVRIGFENAPVDIVEIARRAEDAGAAAIAVHGRTRQQYYSGTADWDIIRQVKEAVSIPVIGNGDVDSPLKAEALLKQTGCDGVMIGRAVRGNPWIFREMNHYFQTGELLPRPSSEEIREMILRHARAQIALKGEFTGIREMRKHVAWYTAGMRHSAGLRRASNTIESYEALQELLMKL